MRRFDLRAGVEPQKYGIGLKELWEVDAARHQPGVLAVLLQRVEDLSDGGGC